VKSELRSENENENKKYYKLEWILFRSL
jgi:hypothetical protein